MARRREGHTPAGNGLKRLRKGVCLELLQAMLRIQPGVERQRRRVLRELVAVEESGVFFLQMATVGQQDGAQVARARRAVDGAGVAIAHQQGQVAAVVQVRVREHHGVDLAGRHGQRLPVAQAQRLVALEQPAVEQQALALVGDQVLGAGDGAGATEEGYADGHGKAPSSVCGPSYRLWQQRAMRRYR